MRKKGKGRLLYLPALENQLLLLATAASATRATEMRALTSLMAWLFTVTCFGVE